MKESIYTIPISEVFEEKCGCPLCALQRELETRWVGYITGAAMMEPDVRIKTNEEGFCRRHLEAMLGQRNRLSVALLLQTRLEYLSQQRPKAPSKRPGAKKPLANSCFVCGRVDAELDRLCGNIASIWSREPAFQALYARQECLCLSHYHRLLGVAATLRGLARSAFIGESHTLMLRGLQSAKANVDAFCKLFDYQSGSGEPVDPAVSGAIEQAISFHCGAWEDGKGS